MGNPPIFVHIFQDKKYFLKYLDKFFKKLYNEIESKSNRLLINFSRQKGENNMKNRKRIIVAFLCAAMLAVGVGYAAISDNLAVDGLMKYKTPAAVTDLIDNAIYFDDTYSQFTFAYKVLGPDDGEPIPITSDDVIQINDSFGVEKDTITANVNINGISTASGSVVSHYHATAIYKIVYDSTKITDAPTVTISVATSGFQTDAAEGMAFVAALYDDSDPTCAGAGDDAIDMEAGDVAYVKVQYIYNKPADMEDAEVAGSYGLIMNIATADAIG